MPKFNSLYITRGVGKPFIFLHGLGASISQTVKIAGDFPNTQFISMDFPGHGKSPYPKDNDPSFDFYAEEVIRLMDSLDIEKTVIGGISMGAGVSMSIASRFPSRVKSMVLVRPAWLDAPSPKNLKILITAAEYFPKDFGRDHFSRLESFRNIQRKLPNAALSLLGLFAATQQKNLPKVLWHMVNDTPYTNYEELNRYEIPCSIIANEHDPLHPFDLAKEIHENIHHSSFHKVTSRYKDDNKHRKEVRSIISKCLM